MRNKNLTPQFAVGQHVFHEFRLSEITEMKDGRVTELSDGYVRTGCFDMSDEIFPVTMPGKRLSLEFEHQKNRVRKVVPDHFNLNWPDISRGFACRWVNAMRKLNDDAAIQAAFEDVTKFADELIEAATSIRKIEVRGIRVMRP